MNVYPLSMGTISNVGNLDRLIRLIVGVVLIAVPLAMFDVGVKYVLFAPLIAIPVIGTAIVGWCPLYTIINVSTVTESMSQKFLDQNVGDVDEILRLFFGISMVLFSLMSASNATIEQPWIIGSALLSIPVICSAIIGWDPVYALLKLSTRRKAVEGRAMHKPKMVASEKARLNASGRRDLRAA